MSKPLSRSDTLIAAMHQAALSALVAEPSGQLRKSLLHEAIERAVPLDDWARAGFVKKSRGMWSITPEGREWLSRPFEPRTYLAEVNRRYPSLAEQREIVTILDALDRKITLHRQKRAVLEELFQSLLHKLMTGEIRVADLDLSALQPAPEGAAA